MSRAYAATIATEALVVLFLFLTLRAAALRLGAEGFGEYALARRAVSLVTIALALGLPTALPRYLAHQAQDAPTAAVQTRYTLAALAILLPPMAGAVAATALFAGQASLLFFGVDDPALAVLTIPGIAGLGLYQVVYGWFRGRLRMGIANLGALLALALAPLITAELAPANAGVIIAVTGVWWLALSLLGAAWALQQGEWQRVAWSDIGRGVRELGAYGLPRIISDLAPYLLFALPAFWAAHRLTVEYAGYLALGTSVVQFLVAAFVPIGTVALPHISRLAAANSLGQVERGVTRLLLAALAAVGMLVAGLEAALEPGLPLLMGAGMAGAVGPLRPLLLAAVPYAVYVALRSPLDALRVRPYNTVSVAGAVAAEALLLAAVPGLPPEWSVLAACTLLALLSCGFWRWTVLEMRRAPGGSVGVMEPEPLTADS